MGAVGTSAWTRWHHVPQERWNPSRFPGPGGTQQFPARQELTSSRCLYPAPSQHQGLSNCM